MALYQVSVSLPTVELPEYRAEAIWLARWMETHGLRVHACKVVCLHPIFRIHVSILFQGRQVSDAVWADWAALRGWVGCDVARMDHCELIDWRQGDGTDQVEGA